MKREFNEMTTAEIIDLYNAEILTMNGELTWQERERLIQVYNARTHNIEDGIKTIWI